MGEASVLRSTASRAAERRPSVMGGRARLRGLAAFPERGPHRDASPLESPHREVTPGRAHPGIQLMASASSFLRCSTNRAVATGSARECSMPNTSRPRLNPRSASGRARMPPGRCEGGMPI